MKIQISLPTALVGAILASVYGIDSVTIPSIIRRARQANEQIDFRLVNERKSILEQECQGLVGL